MGSTLPLSAFIARFYVKDYWKGHSSYLSSLAMESLWDFVTATGPGQGSSILHAVHGLDPSVGQFPMGSVATINVKRSNSGSKQPMRAMQSTPQTSPHSSKLAERLLEKIAASYMPTFENNLALSQRLERQKTRPPFSFLTSSDNFKAMTSRMGVLHHTYYTAVELITWKHPSATLSFLSVYSWSCLNPRLLAVLPMLIVYMGILVPAYCVQHPPEPTSLESNPVVPGGPPLRDPFSTKPVPEMSDEFFLNVIDTQNLMGEYVVIYDFVAHVLDLHFLFADESHTTAVCICFLAGSIFIYCISGLLKFLPWRHIFMVLGWTIFLAKFIIQSNVFDTYSSTYKPKVEQAASKLRELEQKEFSIDFALETREAEIFEYQSFNRRLNVWNTAGYVSSYHGVESQEPVPLHAIQPPFEWEYVPQTSWRVDLSPDQWVVDHYLSSLTIVDSDEKWVYDKGHLWRRRRWFRPCRRVARLS